MSELYQTLLRDTDGTSVDNGDLALRIADANEFEIHREASSLDEDQRGRAMTAIADRTRGGGTFNALETGALLTMFDHLTTDKTRAELFADMEDETGISRTQLFRTLAMFRTFGRELLHDRVTAARCTCEALKLLAGKDVEEAARSEALEFARAGNFLTIKVAKNLIRKHARRQSGQDGGTAEKPTPSVSPKSADAAVLWQHSESQLHVLVRRQSQSVVVDDETIVMALEAALAAYKRVTVEQQTAPRVA
ncbi:hypothetical protein [Rhodopirellula bahusiensis]|uniref:Uncharacterized protein n=1 Tax=Rhodopirellula bahusiensis TaxID=2014065 RepID=A0A2G1W2A0_9BACT|nr:hypothetical protein [Rhodopirellula bahusiensis]PHQ33125.1 hypothetical protein CEE69_21940 [Rhodopirellula bahusiensis]